MTCELESSIVFNSTRSGLTELYVMDSDGGNVRRLTDTRRGLNENPAWSRDGRRIAFTTNEGGVNKVRVIDDP